MCGGEDMHVLIPTKIHIVPKKTIRETSAWGRRVHAMPEKNITMFSPFLSILIIIFQYQS